MAAKSKCNVFFHIFMYFDILKTDVNRIFKTNNILFEKRISKCPNVNEQKLTFNWCGKNINSFCCKCWSTEYNFNQSHYEKSPTKVSSKKLKSFLTFYLHLFKSLRMCFLTFFLFKVKVSRLSSHSLILRNMPDKNLD